MSSNNHKFNREFHTDGEPFNNEPQPSFNPADEASRKCQERIDTLIETTKRDLQEGR